MNTENNILKEAAALLSGAKRILLVSHLQPNGDSVGAMLALHGALESLDKNVTAVASEPVPKNLRFISNHNDISNELTGTRDLIIELNTNDKKVDAMRYETKDGKLRIIVSPKKGEYEASDLSFDKGVFQFDVIVVLDTPDTASLDNIYDQHPKLFHDVPVLNIDHHTSNENFGSVNWVDTSASSTCEMLKSLLDELKVNITPALATMLLTGITADTHSFKNKETTPKALSIAGELLGAGADQALISENLYGTKPTSQLKIWGRVLARLEDDKELSLIYSSLTYQDFIDCGASPEQMKGIVDELISHSKASLILLLIERAPGIISVRLRSLDSDVALKVARHFQGSGTTSAAGFELEGINVKEATTQTIDYIRELMNPTAKPVEVPKEFNVVPAQKAVTSVEVMKESKPIADIPVKHSRIKEIFKKIEQPKKENTGRPRLQPLFDEGDDDSISEPGPNSKLDDDE